MSETAIPLDPKDDEELDSAGLTAEQNVEIDKLVSQGFNYSEARSMVGAKPLEAPSPETQSIGSADQYVTGEETSSIEDIPAEE